MALQSFKIENVKAVALAECAAVPRIMVIAGPNGVGKSTVLYQIQQKIGTTFAPADSKVLYQPPHRAIRASNVRRRFTFGGSNRYFADLLSQNEVSGFEGMNFYQPQRNPYNVDEAGSTIKHSFAKLENRYQTAVTNLVTRSKAGGDPQLDLAQIPDIYEPLRLFTKHLLPHLEFEKIDLTNEDDIKCLWKRKDTRQELTLDIDQLSSGEKSLITMFLPMIESEIVERLNQIDPPAAVVAPTDILVIIDEPEQHIHPDLQARLMSYLRQIANSQNLQFIVSTHSPTILDQAWDDELYLMVAAAGDEQNQLRRVATNLERLEALRQLAGSTFAVTSGRSIVCIEGHRADVTNPSDVRILELMFPRATAYTFVPVGNRHGVTSTVTHLRANLPVADFKINVFGITDQDQGGTIPAGVLSWPVCMIENFLLNATAVAVVVARRGGQRGATEADALAIIDEAITAERDEEIRLRVSKALGMRVVKPAGPDRAAVIQSINDQIAPFQALVDDAARVDAAIDGARAEVDDLIANGQAVTMFRGKQLLQRIYHLAFPTGLMAYSEFVHQLAAEIGKDGVTQGTLNDVFDRLERSVAP